MKRLTVWPPVGFVRFGSLRRSQPLNRNWGHERGTPVDRYFIDDFLRRHSGAPDYSPGSIRGHVLEIGESRYAGRFGRPQDIERLDILDVSPTNAEATVIADLTDGSNLASDTFDCVICTQTLVVIFDIKAVVRTLHRILKPGGTLLVTVPGISQICRPDMDEWGDYWRFTTLSARLLFEEVFEPSEISVDAYGNVLAATAFLYGLAAQDLRREELELRDPDYQVTICVKAVKGEGPGASETDSIPHTGQQIA